MGWQNVAHLYTGTTLDEEQRIFDERYAPSVAFHDADREDRIRDFTPADLTTRPTMLAPLARAHTDQPGAGPERSTRPEQVPSPAPERRSDRRSGAPRPDLPDAA